MSHFVIVYDRKSGHSEVQEFGDADAADRARFDAEGEVRSADVEVVTLVADGVDELRATHSRYFMRGGDIVDTFDRLIA